MLGEKFDLGPQIPLEGSRDPLGTMASGAVTQR